MISPEFLGHIPGVATTIGTLGFLMALSKKQRLAIIERDGNTSQMRHYSEDKGFYKSDGHDCDPCDGEGCGLQVHHILPQRLGGLDIPENLITLFECEHNGRMADGTFADLATDFVVHPDMIPTFQAYRDGNSNAFKEMLGLREEILAEGGLYHNPDHDEEMKQTALENTLMAVMNGWEYPQSTSNNEPGKEHHWYDFFLE